MLSYLGTRFISTSEMYFPLGHLTYMSVFKLLFRGKTIIFTAKLCNFFYLHKLDLLLKSVFKGSFVLKKQKSRHLGSVYMFEGKMIWLWSSQTLLYCTHNCFIEVGSVWEQFAL